MGALIHLLTTVRGAKTIVRFFPNDVFTLNNLVECLKGSHTESTILALAKDSKTYDSPLSAGWLLEVCVKNKKQNRRGGKENGN